jgi:hypothetical protein
MTKETKESKESKALSLKTLTKSSVWDIQENDIFRMLAAAEKDAELKDNIRHYASIIRSAFQIEELKNDDKPSLWRCSCGNMNTSKFCENCGRKKP